MGANSQNDLVVYAPLNLNKQTNKNNFEVQRPLKTGYVAENVAVSPVDLQPSVRPHN